MQRGIFFLSCRTVHVGISSVVARPISKLGCPHKAASTPKLMSSTTLEMQAAIISLNVEAIGITMRIAGSVVISFVIPTHMIVVQMIVRKHKKHEGVAPVYRQTKKQPKIPRAAAARRRSRLVLKQEGKLY